MKTHKIDSFVLLLSRHVMFVSHNCRVFFSLVSCTSFCNYTTTYSVQPLGRFLVWAATNNVTINVREHLLWRTAVLTLTRVSGGWNCWVVGSASHAVMCTSVPWMERLFKCRFSFRRSGLGLSLMPPDRRKGMSFVLAVDHTVGSKVVGYRLLFGFSVMPDSFGSNRVVSHSC